ncbi:MAG: hypothetical protein ACOCR6_03705, partial [archaeon]
QTDSDSSEGKTRQINRRTALAAFVGTTGLVGGGIFGYRTFLTEDEPAFASTDLELTADSLTVDTVEGNVTLVELAGDTEVDIGYENFREGDFNGGDDEFDLTIDLEAYEDQGSDGEPDTGGDPDASGELVAFNVDLDTANLPHHTIETELTADDTNQDNSVPLEELDDSGDGISGNYDIFGMEDPDLGDTKTTSLEFTYTVESTTYDGDHSDLDGGGPELTDTNSVETTVHVTAVDDDDLEIAVGGNVIMEGEAEEDPE